MSVVREVRENRGVSRYELSDRMLPTWQVPLWCGMACCSTLDSRMALPSSRDVLACMKLKQNHCTPAGPLPLATAWQQGACCSASLSQLV